MTQPLNIVIAQINLRVGDIEGNAARVIDIAQKHASADLILFPELTLTGYPPEDLLLRPGLHQRILSALKNICNADIKPALLIGHPDRCDEALYNAASLIQDHQIQGTYHKQHLPNYGVFDEKRYFKAGNSPFVFPLNNINIGVNICEDIWFESPALQAKKAAADMLVVINASPYHIGKQIKREKEISKRQQQINLPIIYLNCVGGQDELIFDGGSFVLDGAGNVAWRGKQMQTQITTLTFDENNFTACEPSANILPDINAIYQALVLGTHDYVKKNGFSEAIIGLSGGIDSALTTAIAVDALGAQNVHCLMMPSRYTAAISHTDAQSQADTLRVTVDNISIEPMFKSFLQALTPLFRDKTPDTTEENLQARCRGIMLMALSNKHGGIVLTTANKSESAVGYSTLYGDMAGGFSVLKDIFKTQVYDLARYRNQRDGSPVIPERVITRPASAELSADQTDQDTLPPYEILDDILIRYIEQDLSIQQICDAGFDRDTVLRVTRMVNLNEYKRRQAAPGIRISARAFGKDRRYPITSDYWRDDPCF